MDNSAWQSEIWIAMRRAFGAYSLLNLAVQLALAKTHGSMVRKLLVGLALLGLVLFAAERAIDARGTRTDERVRTLFGIPSGVRVDTASLRVAILSLAPLGTPEREVEASLRRIGIGRDSLTSYLSLAAKDEAMLFIRHDPRRLDIVQQAYAVRLRFDSLHLLRSVEPREWLTGP